MRAAYLLISLCLLARSVTADTLDLSGEIDVAGYPDSPIRAWAMPMLVLESGTIVPPSKQDIYAAASDPSRTSRFADSTFSLSIASGGPHCLFAFADLNDDGRWDPSVPEPFGWYTDEPAGTYVPVYASDRSSRSFDFALTAPGTMPSDRQETLGGVVRNMKGYTVLQLSGDARTRGMAHGRLMARQIVDFFRFYVLEEKLKSAANYEAGFAQFLHSNYDYPVEFETECQAMVEGMNQSGVDLHIPELGRDFSITEVFAINGYIETRAMRSSCTQFAAWGERTSSTDVDGGMITGRNMDGEIDLRRVTVSHFLLIAVDPEVAGQKRYVSMMWPGFIATISGINEAGFYTMENAGMTGSGQVVGGQVPFSWTMRESLAQLDANATPKTVQALVDKHDNDAGGACGPGCITLFATPYHGQSTPAFVLEGDRFGDAIRGAGEVAPRLAGVLVASNHHRKYGVTADRPIRVFDKTPSFSSLWRYEAGMHKLESWDRVGKRIGTSEMRELLQTVAHGTTEYAIVTRPNDLEFEVAIASMKPELWDAPYRGWTTFRIEELFAKPHVASSD